LEGHCQEIECVTYSPDGKWLASAGIDGFICLWNAETSALEAAWDGEVGHISNLVFAPNSAMLAASQEEAKLWAWQRNSHGQVEHSLQARFIEPIQSLAYHPNGTTLAIGTISASIKLIDVPSKQIIAEWKAGTPGEPICSLAYSGDGRRLISGSMDGLMAVWNPGFQPALAVVQAHKGNVYELALARDARTIASVGRDGILRTWDLDSGDSLRSLATQTGPVSFLAFHPDGRSLISAGDGRKIQSWDVLSGKSQACRTLPQGFEAATVFAFNGAGDTLACDAGPGKVRLLNWDLLEDRRILAGPAASFGPLAFSENGQWLAGPGVPKALLVWDLATGACRNLDSATGWGWHCLAFSPDSQTLAAVADWHTVHLIHVSTGKLQASLPRQPGVIECVAFSPDGKWVASGGNDCAVRLNDAMTGQEHRCLQGHRAHVSSVAFSPNGRTLATLSPGPQGEIKLWQIPSGSELLTFALPRGQELQTLAFSPDGMTMAAGGHTADGKGVIHLWRAGSNEKGE
jgi:WD40 repeat protein